MKFKLQLEGLAAGFFLIVSLGAALAQRGPNTAPPIDSNTGLPPAQSRDFPAIDPATGLPLPPPPRAWKDPNWKDPDLILTNVFYDGLPLAEVARALRDQFKGYFDVLMPVMENGSWNTEWQAITIRLQLKNVTASEVFNAMNLVFENDKTPLRWELTLNGHRPTALLRVLAEPNPRDVPHPPLEPKRMIYFVGDLIGDEKSAGMTMGQIVRTVSEVWNMTYGQAGVIQFHKEAQLLIVSGTPDQIMFVQTTLAALRQKAELERKSQPKSAESRSKAEEAKSGGSAGSK